MNVIHFGTGGWRAKLGDGFDKHSILRCAHALGEALSQRFVGATVYVGYDTRRDSKRLAYMAGEALAGCELRVNVSDKACPTPALAWQVACDPACVGGVMLTAGAAPCTYGGLLVLGADGGPIGSAFAEEVERRIAGRTSEKRGEVEVVDLTSAYVDELVRQTDTQLIERIHPKVVVDTLYGTASGLAPQIFKRAGCAVIALHDEQVPDFRGLHPDACEPWVDECERTVVERQADMGLVFDGDCGRLGIVDQSGKLVSRHDLAPLALEHLVLQRGKSGRVVTTLASSARTRLQAERFDLETTLVPVGSEPLYREFAEGDVLLAADERGGLCVPSYLPKRDALQAGLMILELLAGSQEGALEHVRELESHVGRMHYGEKYLRIDQGSMQRLRVVLPGINPQEVCGMQPVRVNHADGLRLDFENGSWLFVRPSRSRAQVYCVAEAPRRAERNALLDAAKEIISSTI